MQQPGSEDSCGSNGSRWRNFPCEDCGADLAFHIGSQALRCSYCGFSKEIQLDDEAEISEQDLASALKAQVAQREDEDGADDGDREARCRSCGATVLFRGNLTTQNCVYCSSPIHLEFVGRAAKRIPIDALLPFGISDRSAREAVGAWLRGLWFAPSAFLKSDLPERLRGVYSPYWTFDAMTFSRYSGERGTVQHHTVQVNGRSKRRRTIRWRRVSGSFQRFFDDCPVAADRSLPREVLHGLEPWPFDKCVPYTPDVLAGYVTKTYDVPLDEGFKIARQRIEKELLADAKREIGGDQQRIDSISTRWDALTYKHVLLPVWLLMVRYQERSYQLVVNAATGEVQGQRPWSWLKIAATSGVVAALLGIAFAWHHGGL